MVGITDVFGSFTPIKMVRNGPVLTCTYFSYGITTKFCCDSDNSKNKHPLVTFMNQHAPTSIKDTKKKDPYINTSCFTTTTFLQPNLQNISSKLEDTPQMSFFKGTKRHLKKLKRLFAVYWGLYYPCIWGL